jgi:hypothetical protein
MPFAKTGLFPSGRDSSGENISHFTAVRMRVTGSGNLDMVLYSLDDVISQNLVPLVMASATNIQPTRLCNFNQQRAALHLSVDVIDEWFNIKRIMLFTKEHATSYPG